MQKQLPKGPKSHRFVVVYRVEAREIAGAAEVRRGWVERVPEPRALDDGEPQPARRGFQDLEELPGLIGGMRVRVGSDVYDSSIEAKLSELRLQF